MAGANEKSGRAGGKFFFVHHPDCEAFALVFVEDGPHDTLPGGFKRLMPGNREGEYDSGVLIEQHEKWYLLWRRHAPYQFIDLESREVLEIEGVRYRPVLTYHGL